MLALVGWHPFFVPVPGGQGLAALNAGQDLSEPEIECVERAAYCFNFCELLNNQLSKNGHHVAARVRRRKSFGAFRVGGNVFIETIVPA